MHLAGTLAALGHRVGLIDADPQANLTDSLKEGDSWDEVEKGEFTDKLKQCVEPQTVEAVELDEPDVDSCDSIPKMSNFISQSQQKTTIYDIFKPMFHDADSKETIRQMNDPDLLAQVNWLKPGTNAGGDPTVLDGKLFLLRGSGKMREFDGQMGTEMDRACHSEQAVPYVGICNKMLNEIGKSKGLDVILVDMSPSPGAMNEALVMSCDYILPPAFAETYSAMAAYGILTENLPSWFSRKKLILEQQENCASVYRLDNKFPKLLPFVLTNYELDDSTGYLDNLATCFVTCIEDFVFDWQAGQFPPQNQVNSKKQQRLAEAADHISSNMVRCQGRMTIPLIPHDKEIFRVCQELGRTLPELNYDFLMAESCELNTPKSQIEAAIEQYQRRYVKFANWVVQLSGMGCSGKWRDKKRKRSPGRGGLSDEMKAHGFRYSEKSSKFSTKKIKTWTSPDGEKYKTFDEANQAYELILSEVARCPKTVSTSFSL